MILLLVRNVRTNKTTHDPYYHDASMFENQVTFFESRKRRADSAYHTVLRCENLYSVKLTCHCRP